MQNLIRWPSIEQFRNVVKNVQHKVRFSGLDDNGNAIFDTSAKLPTLHFEGTVKLHGTNSSVAQSHDGDMWYQSRENIITPERDNAGFAMFAIANEFAFRDLMCTARCIARDAIADSLKQDIVVWGEWCGKGIQKGVAISELPKMFVIFGVAFVDEEGNKTYFTRQQIVDTIDGCREYVLRPTGKIPEESCIYCIYDFPCFQLDIDFENPHAVQNKLNQLTLSVEEECPVGAAFGVNATGEGIVWRCTDENYINSGFWFKVKGEKHSNSKVKILATIDVEKINNLKDLAARLAHNGRLEQAAQIIFDTLNGGEVDIKKTGDMIRWVMSDIIKEDVNIIAASGFTFKELGPSVAKRVRDFVMKKMEM